MLTRSQAFVMAAAMILITAGTASSYPYEDLLRSIPDRCNTITMVNVRGLQRSPMGISRNWAEKRRRDYLGGLVQLPPTVNRVVIGQHLDTTSLQAGERVVLIDLTETMTPNQVLQREAGTMDTVGRLPVVISPRGHAFVFLSSKFVADLNTVNRQEIARWINTSSRSTRPTISKYLEEAAEEIRPGVQITFAVDLTDALDLEGIRKRLKDTKMFEDKRVKLDDVANTLAGIRGLKLSLAVDKEINGEIRVDFATSAEPLRIIGKQLLLHAMQSMGAAHEEVEKWRGSIEGNAYILSGQLTEEGARLLISPAAGRTTPGAYGDIAQGDEPPPPDPKTIPSQRYFRSVTSLLDELTKEKKPKNVSQRGFWYKQYADKIEALPILNVDPELLEFGGAIAATLRGMANVGQIAKDQNAMIQANQIDHLGVNIPQNYSWGASAYTPWGYRGAGWSYTIPKYEEVSNYRAVGNLCSRNAAVEKAYREDTWKNIAEATQTIRKKMVQKYKVEF